MQLPQTLRFRVTLLFTTLLAVVLAVSFFMVSAANLGIFEEQAEQELETGQRVFNRLLEQNNKLLIQATQVLVGDFAFRHSEAVHTEGRSFCKIEGFLRGPYYGHQYGQRERHHYPRFH